MQRRYFNDKNGRNSTARRFDDGYSGRRGRRGRRGRSRGRGSWRANGRINKVKFSETTFDNEKFDDYNEGNGKSTTETLLNKILIKEEIPILYDESDEIINIHSVAKTKLKLSKVVSSRALVKDINGAYDPKQEQNGDLWLVEGDLIDNRYGEVTCLIQGDTGAQSVCIDNALAHKYFDHKIEKILTPKKARLADNSLIKIYERLLLTWRNGKHGIFNTYGYLIPNLNVPLLGSLRFLRKLGFQVEGRRPNFYILPNQSSIKDSERIIDENERLYRKALEHSPEDDIDLHDIEQFERNRVIVPQDLHSPYKDLVYAKLNSLSIISNCENLSDFMMDSINTRHACEAIDDNGKILNKIDLYEDEDLPILIKKLDDLDEKYNNDLLLNSKNEKEDIKINKLGNFQATKEEIDKAMKLCDDKLFGPLDVSPLEKHFDKELADRVKALFDENPEVLAQGRYDYGKVKDAVYHMNFKANYNGQPIYTKQYHLNEEKRLAFTYECIRKKECGIYEDSKEKDCNIPVLMISKTLEKNDGNVTKRMRSAFDFTRLNQHLDIIQTILPTTPIINDILREPGPVIIFDIQNCFENMEMYPLYRRFTKFDSPIGPLQLTRATYGLSDIMPFVQGYNTKKFVTGMEDLAKSIIFVDDGIIKLRPGVTKEEYFEILKRLVMIIKETGYKVNPRKLFLIVFSYIYCGIVHTQDVHHPTPEYIQKCINVKKPATDRDVQCITAAFRFIDNYMYDLAGTMEPISRLESKSSLKEWGPEQDVAFELVKKKINNCFKLKHSTPDGTMVMHTDANGVNYAVVYFQRQWDAPRGKFMYWITGFNSGKFDKAMRGQHIQVKEAAAGARGMLRNLSVLSRKKFIWFCDNKNVVSFWNNDEYKESGLQIMTRLRLATAQLHFVIVHAKASFIAFADFLNRVGAHSEHQDEREKEKRKKLKLKYQEFQKLNLIDFLHHGHEFSEYGFHNHLSFEEVPMKFETNDDYYNYHRGMVAFNEARHGNMDVIVNGVNFNISMDNNILVNNLRLNGNGNNRLFNNYDILTRNYNNILDLSNLDSSDAILIKSVIFSNKIISEEDTLKFLENEFYNTQFKSLRELKHQVLNKKAVWKVSHGHGLTQAPEEQHPLTECRVNIVNNKKKEKKLQFNLNNGLLQSPSNFNSLYPRSILKNGRKSFSSNYFKIPLPTEAQLDQSLQQARVNAYHNYYSCSRHNYDSTAPISIQSCQVFRETPILLSPLPFDSPRRSPRLAARRQQQQREQKEEEEKAITTNAPTKRKPLRRSPRLASKPRVTYFDQAESLPEPQLSKYDGYGIGIPIAELDSLKFRKFFQTLNQSYPLKSTKKIFDLDAFEAAQELDSQINGIYNYLESNNNDYLDDLFLTPSDKIWKQGLSKNYFSISHGLLYYNDTQFDCTFEEGRLVVPAPFRIPIVKYFHHSIHHLHSGSQVAYAFIKQRYWWPGMKEDIIFIINSCPTCNEAKGKQDRNELAPWFSQQPGELVFYDLGGPYLKSIYIAVIIDDFTGIVMLRVILDSDALTMVNVFLNHWVVEHGFPVQFFGDLGSSNYGKFQHFIHKLTGVHGLYATQRIHTSMGKVERCIREVNKQYRLLDIDLYGSITDDNDRETSIFQIRQFLPSIQFYFNSKVSSISGMSPFLLDKGRNLRGIIDVKGALKTLKERVDAGMDKSDQVQYLRDLQKQLHFYKQERDSKQFNYILYNINYHYNNNNRVSLRKYKKGQFVGFYVGDCNRHLTKFKSRYHKCIFIGDLNNGQVKIQDLVDNQMKIVSRNMIKPFFINDPLWKEEFQYKDLKQQMKQKRKSNKMVQFEKK